MHPRFNRIFLALMSLGRRSNRPADVIPHVWRCHCSPEHRDSTKCFLITSCRGGDLPLFQLAHDPTCGFPTKLKLLYTSGTARKGLENRESIAPRIPAQSHGGTACNNPHSCAEL